MGFAAFFEAASGYEARPWQHALAHDETPRDRVLQVPTGFGKTLGVAATWLYHRVVRGDLRWPTRLVWMLPMRTLVEQTETECRRLLSSVPALAEPPGVGIHAFMGGVDPGAYQLEPGRPAILIGTQDMLLSRALNRGYGAARARWPIDFGLLSQDALWVLDEVQLMGVGFATAWQLAAFRRERPSLRPTYTWAMSATLPDAWLTKSPDTRSLTAELARTGLTAADEKTSLWESSTKPVDFRPATTASALAAQMADTVWTEHAALSGPAPLTLAICNTVERARALHEALTKRAKGASTVPLLIHSRFRGAERAAWSVELRGPKGAPIPSPGGRIIVATQVVEAGVDLSADLLVTELCPWASLVQRAGRLARRGGSGRLVVYDLEEKAAAPYDPFALSAARGALALLSDASSRSLKAFEAAHPGLSESLYPFDPSHLLLAEEIEELFDTTADLSGGDLDVSRFIREGDERDLSVAWFTPVRDARGRVEAPAPELRPARDATCAVPFLSARDWLCGKKTGGVEPKRLRSGLHAYVLDYLEGGWRLAQRSDLRPGVTVLVDAAVGGYDPTRGFDPTTRTPVPVVPLLVADRQERTDAAAERDDLSEAPWQTIAFHGHAVSVEVQRLVEQLHLTGASVGRIMSIAARWHDLGKSHAAFQAAIRHDARPARTDLAKAPDFAWVRGRTPYCVPAEDSKPAEPRPGFRHELASTLALFDVLRRLAPTDHPARLGPWAGHLSGTPPRASAAVSPSPIEREILELSAHDFNLVAFLVCSHHGKLRARLHAGPADQTAAVRAGALPIRGVYEGDHLPPTLISASDGTPHPLPVSHLTLEPASLGLSSETGASWTERVDGLRRTHGPFALAFLEALLRAADVRASADSSLRDTTLAVDGPTQVLT
jgi:CRISPR-associated endonuclease/helicase Cas3